MDKQLSLISKDTYISYDDNEFTEYLDLYKDASKKILSAKIAIDELMEIQRKYESLEVVFTEQQLKEIEIHNDKLDYCINYIKRL